MKDKTILRDYIMSQASVLEIYTSTHDLVIVTSNLFVIRYLDKFTRLQDRQPDLVIRFE